jgi:dsDNA-specific endonuclease/ATPase MutS2
MSVTYVLAPTEADNRIQIKMDQVTADIEEEELKVRENLSREIHKWADAILDGCERIGRLDITLAKALYARKHRCVMPEIVKEHVVEFTDGRHLQVEEIVMKKGGEYCPVSISLSQGVTCITGANMGGKTVSLKLVGQISILAQYGYFVPAAHARIGLSNFMQILIGDSQSIERGLSSFGSEMEELKEIMDNSLDRSLLLIDEIASGTNPVEGLALTKSITDYLKQQPFISLITTHFETVTEDKDVVNMQVTGLANADFDRLDKELRYANRRERINIIQKYIDYRLTRVDNNREIPKDALNIAKMLGIDANIIEKAKQYLN